jgi:pSer/pThr/pTyr-binding forkhead associated (FHA) protein/tetratricopeptide (TPR) repeat protein
LWFVVISDQNQTEIGRVAILPDQIVNIGSSPENHIVIPDSTVAPLQAFFYISEDYPVLEDNGSASTILDGFQVTEPAYLTQESQLTFGSFIGYLIYDENATVDVAPALVDDPPPPPPPPSDDFLQDSIPDNEPPYQSQPEYSPDNPKEYQSQDNSGEYPNETTEPPEVALDNSQGVSTGGMVIEQNSGDMDDGDGGATLQVQDAGGIHLGADAIPLVNDKDLKLIAREGYLDGREFVLAYEESFDIGRSPDVEIVLDDPSVSRVHARLKIEPGGTLVIQDLRSTNGTFLNGSEVKKEIASIGDRIRIGEIPFLFTTSNFGTSKTSTPFSGLLKSKKAIFVIVGFILVVTMMFIVQIAIKNRNKIKKPTLLAQKEDYQDSLNEQVAKLKAQAKSMAEVDHWDSCIAKYKSALSLMPEDKTIKRKLSHASFERKNYRIFKKALFEKNRMTFEGRLTSLRQFRLIDKSSQYYRSDLSPIIHGLKKSLATYYKNAGMNEYTARQYTKAANNLCSYFLLDSGVDDIRTEQKIRLALLRIERIKKWKRNFPKCENIRFKEARILVSDLWAKEASTAIKKKYYKGIGTALISYFSGNPKDAILRLDNLLKTRRGKRRYKEHLTQIIQLKEQLQSVIQRYESGETKLQQNDPNGALVEWNVVRNLDKQLIPFKWKSRYRRNIANRLSHRYYEDGKKDLDVLRYEDAFKLFKKGLDLDPDDTTELRSGIKELEQKAMELFDEAVSYQQTGNSKMAVKTAKRIINITQKNSPTHKKVVKAFK